MCNIKGVLIYESTKENKIDLELVIFDEPEKRTRARDVTSLTDVDEVGLRTNPQRFQP